MLFFSYYYSTSERNENLTVLGLGYLFESLIIVYYAPGCRWLICNCVYTQSDEYKGTVRKENDL